MDERGRVRLRLTAGPHVIAAAFVARSAAVNPTRLQPFVRSSTDTRDTSGHPHFDLLTVTGPFNPTGPGATPSRARVFTCRPKTAAEEDPCARKIIATLARRAYRGDVTDVDQQRLFALLPGRPPRPATSSAASRRRFSAFSRARNSRFTSSAIRRASRPARSTGSAISSWPRGCRSSCGAAFPTISCIDRAREGRLHTPAVLEQQVRRMLADPKAEALTTNFAGQWLYLRNLKNMQPNSEEFPDFDDNLRQAFEREASLFFDSIVREDRNVLDLMTADYTFVNARLAKHYGIPNVYGSQFRRVTLPDDTRRGLLGKGAVLMVTSHTDRTSPVVRGKWILDNLLGAPPPAPPADVPPLNENPQRAGRVLSMRERMEEHRANPVCANCHKLMDPIGLSLENFDAVGAWRARDGDSVTEQGTPIDANGQLLDGTKVDGVVTLRQALLRQPEIFVSTVTEKLLTYALGRGLQPYDMPAVRAIVGDAAPHRVPFFVDGVGHRQQHAVSEAESPATGAAGAGGGPAEALACVSA